MVNCLDFEPELRLLMALKRLLPRLVTLCTVSPSRLTVSKGTTVTFSWKDGGTRHNVTSIGKKRFKTISDRTSGKTPVRFGRAGTYQYECTLHPGMSGRITVR